MHIRLSKKFRKAYDVSGEKIRSAFDLRFKLFIEDQTFPLLNNHALTGKFKGYRSINITGDWRAVYHDYQDEKQERIIIFDFLGTHSQLYK